MVLNQIQNATSLNQVSVVQFNTITGRATNNLLTDNITLNIDNSSSAMIYNGTSTRIELALDISYNITSNGAFKITTQSTSSENSFINIQGDFNLDHDMKRVVLLPNEVLNMVIMPSKSDIKDKATVIVSSYKNEITPLMKDTKSLAINKDTKLSKGNKNFYLFLIFSVLFVIILFFILRRR